MGNLLCCYNKKKIFFEVDCDLKYNHENKNAFYYRSIETKNITPTYYLYDTYNNFEI